VPHCSCVAERRVEFSAHYFKGRASLDEVRHAVTLLMSSGADWTNRMRTLAALAPDLVTVRNSCCLKAGPGRLQKRAAVLWLRLKRLQSATSIPQPASAPLHLRPLQNGAGHDVSKLWIGHVARPKYDCAPEIECVAEHAEVCGVIGVHQWSPEVRRPAFGPRLPIGETVRVAV
jgi:hypothetical protein